MDNTFNFEQAVIDILDKQNKTLEHITKTVFPNEHNLAEEREAVASLSQQEVAIAIGMGLTPAQYASYKK